MFNPVKTTKVYEEVIKQIQQMIMSGDLKSGQKLPSERDLADQLQVGRASIREAFRALQIIGLIEVKQGEGSYIRESFEEFLFQPLSLLFIVQQSNPREIIELRRIIEVEAAFLAAERATEDEIYQLSLTINELMESDSLHDEKRSAVADQKFHYLIARASKNLLLLNILHVSSGLIDNFIVEARERITTTEEKNTFLSNQHLSIFKAIRDRNPSLAKLAMKEHIDFISDEYFKQV